MEYSAQQERELGLKTILFNCHDPRNCDTQTSITGNPKANQSSEIHETVRQGSSQPISKSRAEHITLHRNKA